MKKVILLLAVLAVFSGSLIANTMNSFKVCTHLGPDRFEQQQLLPYEKIGIDINTYSLRLTFNQWCNNQYDPYSAFNPQYGMDAVDSGGYKGWQWYGVGSGLIGRYVDWWACADSMAIWDKLAGMYADSMTTCHAGDEGFAMYRIIDGDSNYENATSARFFADGFERLHDSLASYDPCLNYSSVNPKRHYTYFWGGLSWPPYGLSQILDWMPDLDVAGPGAYVFRDGVATQDALDQVVDGCQVYAHTMKSKNRGLMILLQCGRQYDDSPTFPELRAASWLALAHGNAWLGYYSYRVGSSVYPDDEPGTAVGAIEGNKSGSQQLPYVEDPQEFRDEFGLSESEWPDSCFNTNANFWMNLYDVIKEIREVDDVLADISWDYSISKHLDPLPYGYVNNVTGAQYVDLGYFNAYSEIKYLMVVNREQVEKTISVYIKPLGKNQLRVTDMADRSNPVILDYDYGSNSFILTKSYEAGQGKLFKLEPYGDKPRLGLTGKWSNIKLSSGFMELMIGPGEGGGNDWRYAVLDWEWLNYVPPTLTRMSLFHRWDFSQMSFSEATGKDISNPATARTGRHCVPMQDSVVQYVEAGHHPDGDELEWPPGMTEIVGTRSNFVMVAAYEEETGCPDLYTFIYEDTNASPGHTFIQNNTILPHSAHMLQVIAEDLLVIDTLNCEPDHYYMGITENEDETSYLDQVKLWVVDHPEYTHVGTSANGSIYVYSDIVPPSSCTDDESNDRLQDIILEDSTGYKGDSTSYLSVKFTDPGWSNTGLLMSMGFQDDDDNSSSKIYAAEPNQPDSGGTWDSLGIAYARLKESRWIVDVSDCDSFTFRIYCRGSDTCRIDRIALVKLVKDYSLTAASLDSAVKYASIGTPELVTTHLCVADTFIVTLTEEEQIALRFDKVDTSTTYDVRDFVFNSRGYYNPNRPQGSGGPQSSANTLRFDLDVQQVEPLSRAAYINYSVPYQTKVKIAVYDVAGRMVMKIIDEEVDPGLYTFNWKGNDHTNRGVASGIYFIKMIAIRTANDEYRETTKIVIME